MEDRRKTKSQLINELIELRQYLSRLESPSPQTEPPLDGQAPSAGRFRLPEEEFGTQFLTLRGIIDSTSAVIFSVDHQYRYTHYNQQHARVMRQIYGQDIEVGHTILDYMTVAEDREKAKRNLDRALGGEQFVESAYSGEAGLARLYFEVSHHPIKTDGGAIIGVAVISSDITERKRAEVEIEKYRVHLEEMVQQRTEQLQESEALYRSLFEHMNTIMLIVDPQTTAIVEANPAACKFYGYPHAALLELRVSQINVLSEEQIRVEMERARAQEKAYFNFRHRLASGEVRDVEIYSGPVTMGGKQRLLSVIHDNTERKRAEEQLRKLSRAVEQSPASIVITDTQGIIEYVNPKFTELTGYSPEEAVGQNPRILKTDYTPAEAYAELWKTITSGASWHGIFCNRKKDGEIYWETASISPVVNDVGAVTHFVAVKENITDRKLAEEEAFRSRQMLQLVMDNIPLLVFWKDRNLVYLGCNQVCAAEAGFTHPAEIIGKTDFDLRWKELAQHYREDDLLVMETDTPKLDFEEPIPQPDGSQVWVRTTKMPLHDRDGKVIGLLGSSEDITERKLTEQEIQRANEQLIGWVSDLEKRNQEASLLRQMSGLLQVCSDPGESYAIIKEHIEQLFPHTTGALLMTDEAHTTFEARLVWGETLCSESSFTRDDCWALRRSQLHAVKATTPGLGCRHILKPFSGSYLEIPLVASGETMGLLHIEGSGEDGFVDSVQGLALTLGNNLSLSLSNLKLRETLRSQSIRDVLTGLFNRRYMEESLARELPRASRKHSQVGIIMLDIDHFKQINDTYGHEAGDLVLHELGTLLQVHIRREDIACRFGGEEFVLILPEASLDITTQRAEYIREKVKALRVEYQRQALGAISVSLGVAIFPDHSSMADGILKKADEALYQAKRNGRDRVEVARVS